MSMPDYMFKKLSDDEEEEYRLWAMDNYEPGSDINPVWHPVVRRECERINGRDEARGDPEDSDESQAVEEVSDEKV
jgi:hypothetical protein